jgi:hypothetical protein
MKKPSPTNSLTDAVVNCLNMRYLCFAWRQNTTGTYRADLKRFVAPPSTGVSDILCCYRGRLLCLEIKKPREKLKPSQQLFREKVEAAGAIYAIITNLDDLIALLNELDAQ